MGHRDRDGTPSRGDGTPANARNPTLRCISVRRRRAVLRVLLGRSDPTAGRELARRLAAADGADFAADVIAAERRAVRTDLVHRHLPALEAAGLVARDREGATVETTAHPALEDPRFRRLLEMDAEHLDDVLSALSHERRRRVLTVLREDRTTVSRTGLARELLRRETGTDLGSEAVDDAVASLHHVDLPSLDDADVIDYDRETGRVAYADHPTLEAVFETIYEPNACLAAKLDGFLDGLGISSRRSGADASERFDWPHFWRRPHRG